MSGAAGSSQWMYASGYTAETSLKFNDDDASYLTRTPASAGNRRTFTFSAFFKRGNVNSSGTRGVLFSAYSDSNNYTYIGFDDGGGGYDRLRVYSLTSSSAVIDFESTAQFRDTSGWYHLVVSVDTTQGTSGNRVKIYINGEQVTAWATSTEPSEDYDTFVNNNVNHSIGSFNNASSYFDGYMAEVNLVDGSALTPSSFISTGAHGKILPRKYGGSHGTNGFYLPFKMDYEVEGFNAINWDGRSLASRDEFYIGGVGFEPDVIWTKSLESTHDHFLFTRHNGVGHLANVRPNQINGAGMPNHSYDFLNEFNTDGYTIRGGQYASAYLARNNDFITWAWDMGSADAGHYLYPKTFTAGGNAHISTDRYKFGSSAIQLDGNGDYFKTGWNNNFNHYRREFTIEYWINMEDNPSSTQHGHLGQAEGDNYWRINHNSTRIEVQCEVGGNTQWNFNTSGHGTQIDTANQWYHIALVKQGSRVILYLNGSEAGRQEMADGEFKWIEADFYLGNYNGSASSWFKGWMDEIRISRVARYTGNFTVASAAFSNDKDTILLIHAEGSDNSTTLTDSSGAPANTNGSGTSYVSANDTYGQSLISYVGTSGAKTLGHGLSAAPEVILVKNRSSNQEWLMYHANNTAAPQTDYLRLDTTAATADNTFWNDTAPTSSVFSVGDSQPVNSGHGNEYFALAFRSVTGYSKFGTYTGDASTDGSLSVTTGFKPAFLMVKRTDSTGGWVMVDSARNPNNPVNRYSQANVTDVEATGSVFNFTSTGFTLLANLADINANNGTYVYLAFADTKEYSYYHDHSGNNNDWRPYNLDESKISIDTPNNSFATLSPEIKEGTITLSDGNLYGVGGNSSTGLVGGTFPPLTSGKWYFEQLVTNANDKTRVGFRKHTEAQNIDNKGFAMNTQSDASTSYDEDFANGGASEGRSDTLDVIGHALNLDDLEMKFFKNGIDEATYDISAASAAIGYVPSFYDFSGSGADTSEAYFNFGQDSSFGANYGPANGKTDGNDEGDFVYEPPSGHLAMCTNNLTDSAVTAGQHFNTVIYTGNASNRSITGVGFQPDMVWFKNRDATEDPCIYDAIRGAEIRLTPNATDGDDDRGSVGLTSFDSDGFTIGSGGELNGNNQGIVAWCWKANGAGSQNTSGTINTTATSANTAAGFSMIAYGGNGVSGATIGHGLSKAPEFFTVKRRSSGGDDWNSYYGDNTDFLRLNGTAATSDNSAIWNDTSPTSTLISLGNHAEVNSSGETYMCYAWHSVEGYSKIGTYLGNGNAAGTFVYTGFKPAYVIIKPVSRTGHWFIANNKSSPNNVVDKVIISNDNAAEYTDPNADCKKDFLSNGFRIRTTDDNTNEDGSTYLFMAFAETQQKYSNAR